VNLIGCDPASWAILYIIDRAVMYLHFIAVATQSNLIESDAGAQKMYTGKFRKYKQKCYFLNKQEADRRDFQFICKEKDFCLFFKGLYNRATTIV
jgi:hypothetical protein